MTSYKNILAIGAHPDDIELGCAGTLCKFMDEGANVDIVIARDDNAPKPSVQRSRDKTISEYKASQEMLGIEFVFMNNPLTDDGRPVLEWNNTSIEQMDKLVSRKQYDLIITHSPGDHHNDHVNTYRIVNSALRRYQGEFWLMECCPYANKNHEFLLRVSFKMHCVNLFCCPVTLQWLFYVLVYTFFKSQRKKNAVGSLIQKVIK